jgi:hypothetical protein
MVQVSEFEKPWEPVVGSAHGDRMTHFDWCRIEAQRIAENGRRACVMRNGGMRVALFAGREIEVRFQILFEQDPNDVRAAFEEAATC